MKKLIVIMLAVLMVVVSVVGLAACDTNTIVVYTNATFPPFEYTSGKSIVGVDIEIMELVGKELGKKVKFENVDFDIIVDTVAAGKLCQVGAAGISVTDERKAKVDFSNEYYTAKLYVIYKVSDASVYESNTTDGVKGVYWDDLAGKNIGIQGGTTADLFLTDELDSTADYAGVLYNTGAKKTSYDSLFTAVADIGVNTNVVIIDELPAQQLIAGNSELTCAPLYWKGGDGEADEAAVDVYAICVTKGQDELLAAINKVLADLGEEGIQALVNKHLGITK